MGFERAKELAFRLGLYRQARWLNRHLWDRKELRQEQLDRVFYSQFIKPGDVVFDVGANYGQKSRVFLRLGAKVVACEPQPDCREELQRRCGRNPRLEVVASALGSSQGEASLYVRTHRGSSGLVRDWASNYTHVEAEIRVPVTTLDSVIAQFGAPTFIKIDVEGFEWEVIKGLSQGVPLIQFEFHLTDHEHKLSADNISRTIKVIDHLSQFGELRLNIAPAESSVLGFAEWLPKDDFVKRFESLDPSRFAKLFPNVPATESYGDVFVRMTSAPA